MSTKQTIQHHSEPGGKSGYHMYKEVLDDDKGPIYLQLAGVEFTAKSPDFVVVTIPRDWANMLGLVWDTDPTAPASGLDF